MRPLLSSGSSRRRAPRLWAAALALFVCALPVRGADYLLTLTEAVERAVAQSPAVQAAQARFDAARGRLAEAEAGFLPRVSLSGTYTRLDEAPSNLLAQYGRSSDQLPKPSKNAYDARLSVSYPLYTGGAQEAGREAAQAGLAAAQAQVDLAVQETAFATAQGYYGLLSARQMAEIARLGLQAAESHAAQVQAAYEAGTVLRNDLLRVQVQVGNARQSLIKAEHALALAEASFRSLTGLDPATGIRFPELAPPAPLTEDLDRLIASALDRRPELVALRQSVGAARSGVKAAEAQLKPTAASAFTVNLQGGELSDLDGSWSLMLTASYNVFDGGAARARIRQAEAGLTEAEKGVRQAEEGIRLEVRQAYQALREAEEAFPVAQATRRQAEENLELVKVRFEAGLATPADVTDAQLLLAQARTGHIQAINDHLVALARLAKVTGTPVGVR